MTMIELLVVIAMITILFAAGVVMSMQSFRSYTRRSERDTIVAILQKARSRSLSNVQQHKWGACFDGTNYHVFFGSYPSTPMDTIEGNTGAVPSGAAFLCSNGGIVFDQLTGNTPAVTISIAQGGVTSNIATNAEGRIDW